MTTSLRDQIMSGTRTPIDIALLMDGTSSFHIQVSSIRSTSNGLFDTRKLVNVALVNQKIDSSYVPVSMTMRPSVTWPSPEYLSVNILTVVLGSP